MTNCWLVRKEQRMLRRYASAISWTLPVSLTSCCRMKLAMASSPSFSSIGVRMAPGEILLTRMGAMSTAGARARDSTAPHQTMLFDKLGSGLLPRMPDVRVIDELAVALRYTLEFAVTSFLIGSGPRYRTVQDE
jgi:hypothetical protein